MWFIYEALRQQFEVVISGYDYYEPEDGKVQYVIHSHEYRRFTSYKSRRFLGSLYRYGLKFYLFFRRQHTVESVEFKLRLWLLRLDFEKKHKKCDFVVNIDAEASFISSRFCKRKRIPCGFNIYEIFAEQWLGENKSSLYKLKTEIERRGIESSQLVFSSANKVLAEFLLSRYQLKRKIVELTVCPYRSFSDNITVNEPLKFYYHGAFFKNRGLENLVMAMKEVEGAVLYLRGYGHLEKELRLLVSENKLEKKVIFLEPVPTELLTQAGTEFDIGLTMARMNVLNHIYAVGFKTFENLSAGLALVLPESYPLKKLNEDYNVGVVYQDATVENMKAVISYCVNNKTIVKSWKANARKAYSDKFNPEFQKANFINEITRQIELAELSPRIRKF